MASSRPPGPSQRVALRGGFSPITGMTFQGQNEEKGRKIMDNLFNIEVEEVQNADHPTATIRARMLSCRSAASPSTSPGPQINAPVQNKGGELIVSEVRPALHAHVAGNPVPLSFRRLQRALHLTDRWVLSMWRLRTPLWRR